MKLATRIRRYSLLFLLAPLPAISVAAGLQPLSDDELANVSGQGLGFMLEDFKFAHGTDGPDGQIFKITGLKSTDGRDVELVVNQLYISGPNSQYGTQLSGVNLGRLVNPYSIDVRDGNDIGIPNKAVFEFAAPRKVDPTIGFDCLSAGAVSGSGACSSRPAGQGAGNGERPDIGLQLNIAVGNDRSANVNVHAQSAVIDGSYIRLWGDDERKQLVGEIKLNFYTPELSINACSQDGNNCGSRILMSNFELELALGNRLQPLFFDVDSSGNFIIEVAAIPKPAPGSIGADGRRPSSNSATWDFYNDYYTNPDFRSNVRIGELSVSGQSYGSARVEGMLIQHLKIETRSLGQ
ncbi:MAG: hypothetical protein LAT63_05970 [Marinobacter sp.]|nr:hypothetical protein [Marinobacter sp.]